MRKFLACSLAVLCIASLQCNADLCPDKAILAPFCTCYQFNNDVLPALLCENFETADQMFQVFNNTFPSNDLKSLTIEYSKLPKIKADSLADKTFKQINIERTKIKSIDRHAFQGSKDTLEILMVVSNEQLAQFPFDGLWGFEKLSTIILSDLKINSIRTLPSLPNLKKFAIQELRSLKVLPQLPYLPSLTTLKFISTGIQTVEESAFEHLPALEKFEFDANDIKVVKKGYFKFYSQVKELSFEENGIEEIEEGAIGGVKSAVLVSFSKNKIRVLKERAFKPLLQAVGENAGKVLFIGNQLDCFCDMRWLIGDAVLIDALFEAKCAGKTDIATLTKGFLDPIC